MLEEELLKWVMDCKQQICVLGMLGFEATSSDNVFLLHWLLKVEEEYLRHFFSIIRLWKESRLRTSGRGLTSLAYISFT